MGRGWSKRGDPLPPTLWGPSSPTTRPLDPCPNPSDCDPFFPPLSWTPSLHPCVPGTFRTRLTPSLSLCVSPLPGDRIGGQVRRAKLVVTN